jgi:hypothetical protein
MTTVKINDEVVYQLRRWTVMRIIPAIQSLDPAVPRKPDQLILFRYSDNEGTQAPADQVVVSNE